MNVSLTRPDPADPALAARWAAMAQAVDAPAFLRWPWIGALLAQPGVAPLLAEMSDAGRTVALALLQPVRSRAGRGVLLHESGQAAIDALFIEHNGPLAAAADRGPALAALLRACGRRAGRVRLAGIDDALLRAAQGAGGVLGPVQTRPAPFAPLGAGPVLAGLSRNTRAQVRRSIRSYEAAGPLRVEVAEGEAQGLAWLDVLLQLHRAGWARRGVASGFVHPAAQGFVRRLVRLGAADAGCRVEVVRVSAGARIVGYLLNLRAGGRVLAYQSGFDYAGAGTDEKPGLTCHVAAMQHAADRGEREYDFLGGDARYKRSLAPEVRALHWVDWHPALSVGAGLALARRVAALMPKAAATRRD